MEKKATVGGLFSNAKETRTVDAGAVIFDEGDEGTDMFGIIAGEVELRAKGVVLRRLGPQEVFGEMALIDNSPRSLTAIAISDTTLATIDRRRFLFLVHETPTFALNVMSVVAEHLRDRG